MKFQKMMVALDRSSYDKNLIQYSQFIAKTFDVTSILFVHVVQYPLHPKLVNKSLENLAGKNSLFFEKLRGGLEREVQPVFKSLEGGDVKFFVVEGQVQDELLQMIEKEKPDLLVLGKKQMSDGSGVIAHRVARNANTAVWFVTENPISAVQKILVPIDFSDNSFRALKTAFHLKEQLKGVTITALHLIDIPMTAYKIDRDKEAIIAGLKAQAVEAFRMGLGQHQIKEDNLEIKIMTNDDFDVARSIEEQATQENSDLIITGAKGRSLFTRFLFGSVTEKLITYEMVTSILVVR